MNWFNTEYQEIAEFLPFSFESSNTVMCVDNEKIVCITGKLKSFKDKKTATITLNQKGFTVVDSLTKTVKFLIDESDKISSKRTKAEATGIIVVTDLSEFLQNN